MNIKTVIKNWLGLPVLHREIAHLCTVISAQQGRITKRIAELDELTREDVDVGFRGNSTIILTGVYRGRGYVKFYDVPADEFEYLVDRFRSGNRRSVLRHVDAPHYIGGAFDLKGDWS